MKNKNFIEWDFGTKFRLVIEEKDGRRQVAFYDLDDDEYANAPQEELTTPGWRVTFDGPVMLAAISDTEGDVAEIMEFPTQETLRQV